MNNKEYFDKMYEAAKALNMTINTAEVYTDLASSYDSDDAPDYIDRVLNALPGVGVLQTALLSIRRDFCRTFRDVLHRTFTPFGAQDFSIAEEKFIKHECYVSHAFGIAVNRDGYEVYRAMKVENPDSIFSGIIRCEHIGSLGFIFPEFAMVDYIMNSTDWLDPNAEIM